MKLKASIRRRCEFLLAVASDNSDGRDQAVTFVMRVLSNHATIGKDAGSATIKRLNRRISRRAFERLTVFDWNTFKSTTVNEHPKPLKQMWHWMTERSETLKPDDVWQEFLNHPMITVTKEEHQAMPSSDGNFTERYKGIEVLNLDLDPYKYIVK